MIRNSPETLVLCFGEALWDVFTGEMHPGGAPLNVAYHLSKLGYRVAPVSAIGKDALGIRLLHQMQEWGLDTSLVTQVDHRLTGLVKVTLKQNGDAIYEIQPRAAWDCVTLIPEQLEIAEDSAAIVFGTLALRGYRNRRQLANLLARCPNALKIYDVNLRPPHTRIETVWEIAKYANAIKLTADELETLMPDTKRLEDLEGMAARFSEFTSCDTICVTAGASGAGLLYRDAWYWAAGRPVQVIDTVGAGDSFLAGLVHGFLSHSPPQNALENACRLGEFVATREGPTPGYDISNLEILSNGKPRQHEGLTSFSASSN